MALNLHFSYEPGRLHLKSFVTPFVEALGSVSPDEADIVVAVGGDGALIHAFHHAQNGQKVFGMVPPNTASLGFWSTHEVKTSDELIEAIGAAEDFELHPLRADITLRDGAQKTIHAYNDMVPGEFGSQAMEGLLTIHDGDIKVGPAYVKGGGLIVSTPYGSSAMNMLYGGDVVDIRVPAIILTGKGLRGPKGAFTSAVLGEKVSVEVNFHDASKRPARIQYDGFKEVSSPDNPFDKVVISLDEGKQIQLLTNHKPILRALDHVM
jgi:NAD+ kinase